VISIDAGFRLSDAALREFWRAAWGFEPNLVEIVRVLHERTDLHRHLGLSADD